MNTKFIRQEWARPTGYWESGNDQRMTPYAGCVAVKTNNGWLILVNVFEIDGQIRRIAVKPEEVPEFTPTW